MKFIFLRSNLEGLGTLFGLILDPLTVRIKSQNDLAKLEESNPHANFLFHSMDHLRIRYAAINQSKRTF